MRRRRLSRSPAGLAAAGPARLSRTVYAEDFSILLRRRRTYRPRIDAPIVLLH